MTELRKLQMALLDIALEVKRICEKNNIPYILCGGSLLGAVRHQGFIPWDDDMDIAMLREDYERFLKICPEDLGVDFVLQTYKSDLEYANSFAKVGIQGTVLSNPMIKNDKAVQRISIDIFPLDVFPRYSWQRKVQNFCEKNYLMAAYLKAGYEIDVPCTLLGKMRRCLIKNYADKHSLSEILAEQVLCETKYNQKDIGSIGIVFFEERYQYKTDFLNRISVTFENFEFTIPKSYDAVLRGIYGNYKKLPPVEDRITHNFSGLQLNRYQIKNTCYKEELCQ